MTRLAITTAAALTAPAAVCACGGRVNEGEWGSPGLGDAETRLGPRVAGY